MNKDPKDELDIDGYFESHKESIEAAIERIHKDKTRAPEGYYTLAEFDELFHKKLDECYAELRKDPRSDNSKKSEKE